MITLHLGVRSQSTRKQLYRRAQLQRLAERVCTGESIDGALELSLLFCDDAFIAELNERYRGKRGPTDVLSFGQNDAGPPDSGVLGDIVISLETVERFCGGDRRAMRQEVLLLFCHGLLHLLGHDHATAAEKQKMHNSQAKYLDITTEAAWRMRPEGSRGVRGEKDTLGRRQ